MIDSYLILDILGRLWRIFWPPTIKLGEKKNYQNLDEKRIFHEYCTEEIVDHTFTINI